MLIRVDLINSAGSQPASQMLKKNSSIISSCAKLHNQSISVPCQEYINIQMGKLRHQEIEKKLLSEEQDPKGVVPSVMLCCTTVSLSGQAFLEDF